MAEIIDDDDIRQFAEGYAKGAKFINDLINKMKNNSLENEKENNKDFKQEHTNNILNELNDVNKGLNTKDNKEIAKNPNNIFNEIKKINNDLNVEQNIKLTPKIEPKPAQAPIKSRSR